HLQRWPAGAALAEVAAGVKAVFAEEPLAQTPLWVDITGTDGVGRDAIWRAGPRVQVRAVVVGATSGPGMASRHGLATAMRLAAEDKRLEIAAGLPDAARLTRALAGFRAEAQAAGQNATVPWRQGPDDDLALAVALAVWKGETMVEFMAF